MNRKGNNETKQENKIDPRLDAAIFGPGGVLQRAQEIASRPAWSQEMGQSADAFRNYLQSAAFTQPNTDLVNMGSRMVNTRAAGNPFTQGGISLGGQQGLAGGMGGAMGLKNAGITPAQRAQNFAGFGSPESLRSDNYTEFTAPQMMAALTKPAVDRVEAVKPSVVTVPEFTQEDFDRMFQARLLSQEYSNVGGG
jgi:hypothetical protein